MFRLRRLVAVGAAAPLFLLVAAPASAHSVTSGFREIKQVSNVPGKARLTDPDAVNSWGLALSPTSPLWVANNGTNTATIYTGGLHGATVGKAPLTVTIDTNGPTGQVFNGTGKFVIRGGPAAFIFDSESGDIAAWSPNANRTHARVITSVPGAVFKGLALWTTPLGPFLLATDFVGGRVDVFDSRFHRVDLHGELFRDPHLPKGYAPFNVLTVGDRVYVTYAKQQPGSADEAHGPGLGLVDVYTNLGTVVHRVATFGKLNAPWGLAIAPHGFGNLGGDLLVGNFGDGRINIFHNGCPVGQLSDSYGRPITIDGLWALLPGTATTGGVHTVWFSSGPNDENDGLVGQLVSAG